LSPVSFEVEEVSREELDSKYFDPKKMIGSGPSEEENEEKPVLIEKVSAASSGRRVVDNAFSKLFGANYSSKESTYVLIAGALIAFNNGFVNGSCVSGLLNPGKYRSQSVAGFSSTYTKSALFLADAEWSDFGFQSGLVLSYMFGALISGLITPRATPYQIEPTYGPTFLIGGIFLLIASIISSFQRQDMDVVFYFTAAANGIHNGIASIYSANLIRCSLTGASTDIALTLAQLMRGNKANMWKGIALAMIVFSFWIGGIVSFYATQRFLSRTLFVNAALFWLIGFSLIYFLVHEIGISFKAALFGTWRWKVALKRMATTMHASPSNSDMSRSVKLFALFDKMDKNGDGSLDTEELHEALNRSGLALSRGEVAVLVKAADRNGDGVIDRSEWADLVARLS